MKVALFDFDGTLYPKETFNILMDSLKNHPKYHKNYKKFMRKFTPIYLLYKMKVIKPQKMKRDAMKEFIFSFKDDSYSDVLQFFNEIGKEFALGLRPNLMEQVRAFREQDVKTIVISGAYQELLDAIFNDEFDVLVGSQVEVKDDKVDTKAGFTHLQSTEKVKQIHDVLSGKVVDWDNSYAFSDSIEDIEMLNLVGNVTVVHPDEALLKQAKNNQWKVYEGAL